MPAMPPRHRHDPPPATGTAYPLSPSKRGRAMLIKRMVKPAFGAVAVLIVASALFGTAASAGPVDAVAGANQAVAVTTPLTKPATGSDDMVIMSLSSDLNISDAGMRACPALNCTTVGQAFQKQA